MFVSMQLFTFLCCYCFEVCYILHLYQCTVYIAVVYLTLTEAYSRVIWCKFAAAPPFLDTNLRAAGLLLRTYRSWAVAV